MMRRAASAGSSRARPRDRTDGGRLAEESTCLQPYRVGARSISNSLSDHESVGDAPKRMVVVMAFCFASKDDFGKNGIQQR